jgi:hypothetical protein
MKGGVPMAKMYCQWVGIILIVLGVIGLLGSGELLGANVKGLHSIIHLVSGIILVYLGFTGTAVKTGAQVFGVVYLLVAVLGFVGQGNMVPVLGINTSALYNIVHLVVGALGLYVGFTGGAEMAKT